MASISFPLAFQRQFSGPLDPDLVFDTETALADYLTSPRRYAGQVVTCNELPGTLFILNDTANDWIPVVPGTEADLQSHISSTSEHGHLPLLPGSWEDASSHTSYRLNEWNVPTGAGYFDAERQDVLIVNTGRENHVLQDLSLSHSVVVPRNSWVMLSTVSGSAPDEFEITVTGQADIPTDIAAALSLKADDADVVLLTGNQTIDGIKTFLQHLVSNELRARTDDGLDIRRSDGVSLIRVGKDGASKSGVAMGDNTTASGGVSHAWGLFTEAGGPASYSGGVFSIASQELSYARGYRARSVHKAASVESDSEDADFESTADDQKSCRFAGGYRFMGGAAEFEGGIDGLAIGTDIQAQDATLQSLADAADDAARRAVIGAASTNPATSTTAGLIKKSTTAQVIAGTLDDTAVTPAGLDALIKDGLVLKAPNETLWKLTVNNDGNLITEEVV